MADLRGETISLDPVIDLVLGLCDGTRNRAALGAALADLAQQPDGTHSGPGGPGRTPAALGAVSLPFLAAPDALRRTGSLAAATFGDDCT